MKTFSFNCKRNSLGLKAYFLLRISWWCGAWNPITPIALLAWWHQTLPTQSTHNRCFFLPILNKRRSHMYQIFLGPRSQHGVNSTGVDIPFREERGNCSFLTENLQSAVKHITISVCGPPHCNFYIRSFCKHSSISYNCFSWWSWCRSVCILHNSTISRLDGGQYFLLFL